MHIEYIIGTIAASCTTVSFLPQAIKVIRTRDTSGISLAMYLIFSIGVAFWLTYGIMIANAPIIYSNIITLSLALVILYVKLCNGPTERPSIRLE